MSNVTRWNSTYQMIKAYLENRRTWNAAVMELDDKLPLNSEEKRILEDIFAGLGIAFNFSMALQRDSCTIDAAEWCHRTVLKQLQDEAT